MDNQENNLQLKGCGHWNSLPEGVVEKELVTHPGHCMLNVPYWI